MKKAIVFLPVLLFIGAQLLGAALPERIKPISKVAYPQPYYAEQAQLWKLETEKNSLNPDAWYNYFRAARYANILSEGTPKLDLDAIVKAIPTTLNNTFEYQHIRFMNADWNDSRFQYLLRAHELAPHRTEVFHDLVTYHLTRGDEPQAQVFIEKLFAAGEFPAELLAWNYNLLASVEQNAILFTYGDNDTYPLWVLQSVKKIRPDVKVLNINLLLLDEYRSRIFQRLGIQPLEPAAQPDQLGIAKQILTMSGQPVYFAATVPENLRLAFADSLYLTGLALKFSTQDFDNLAMLRNHFENKFLIDYLRVDFTPDSISSVMSRMNLTYLPPLLTLHQHYVAGGEQARAEALLPLLRRIAREGGREAELEAYLNTQDDRLGALVPTVGVRELDKSLMKIRGNLYAFSTEVTNGQYEAFLMDLVKNRAFDLLVVAKAEKVDWRSWLPEQYRNLPDSEVYKHNHPDDPAAPVVNISHEAAQLYCDWLTKAYNASNDKKKAHRKLRFRLPTEAEWEEAAYGGIPSKPPYPWGGYFIRNSKGCFLANYDVSKEQPCKDCPESEKSRADDGGFFPVKADSYFPNDFGLYNTSGNVAEMIDKPGVTKGGSWYEIPFYGQISNENTYAKPQPFIGFRVFAEVE